MVDSHSIVPWSVSVDTVRVSDKAKLPDIVAAATRLTANEAKQVLAAFKAESYEMTTVFLWQKTMAGLKTQLEAALGMDFIAEMLGRSDIPDHANVLQVLTDFDAVSLAEQLGMFDSTHALRLRHSLETVSHFSGERTSDDEDSGMNREEAVLTFRVCVQTVLGRDSLQVAQNFSEFRADLESRALAADEAMVRNLPMMPYFFKRTTLRVLIAMVKTTTGAQLDNCLANFNTIIPTIWPSLKKPDRFTVGTCYAELHSDGRSTAAEGVRSALLKVKGFDFVPESIRSRTYLTAADELLDAHFGYNNFHNEVAPMRALANLGSSIPMPALHKCMTATLCVRLGNRWGTSWSAASDATALLKSLTPDKWRYYLEECLPIDQIVLDKLTEANPAENWCDLSKDLALANLTVSDRDVTKLLSAPQAKVGQLAAAIRSKLHKAPKA